MISIRTRKVTTNSEGYNLEYEFFAVDDPEKTLIRKTSTGSPEEIEADIVGKYKKFKENYYRQLNWLDKADELLARVKEAGDITTINPDIFITAGIFNDLAIAHYRYLPIDTLTSTSSFNPIQIVAERYVDIMAKNTQSTWSDIDIRVEAQ